MPSATCAVGGLCHTCSELPGPSLSSPNIASPSPAPVAPGDCLLLKHARPGPETAWRPLSQPGRRCSRVCCALPPSPGLCWARPPVVCLHRRGNGGQGPTRTEWEPSECGREGSPACALGARHRRGRQGGDSAGRSLSLAGGRGADPKPRCYRGRRGGGGTSTDQRTEIRGQVRIGCWSQVLL